MPYLTPLTGSVNVIKELYHFYSDELLKKQLRLDPGFKADLRIKWKLFIQILEKCNAQTTKLQVQGEHEVYKYILI